MAGVTTADVSQILKEQYGTSVADQLNNEVRALKHFERSPTAEWVGKVFVESLHNSRNYGVKATAEGGLLPVAGKQGYAELRVPDRYVHGRIQFTGQFMNEVRDRGSFINGVDSEINGMVRDMSVECNRMVWGDGTGKLALLSADAAASATLSVDTPGGVSGATNGARFIRPGMSIAIHDAVPADNIPNVVQIVNSIAADGTTITVDETVSTANGPDNGVITKGVEIGSTVEGSWQLEPMGILGIFDEQTFLTTIHGLDRSLAANSFFNINNFTAVGNLNEIIFWRALDTCDENSGSEPNWFTCHHSVHREYIKISLGDKRYSGEALMRPDVGIAGGGPKHELTFANTPIEKERYHPYGFFYGIDASVCKRYENQPGQWMDRDGAILHRVADKNAYEATYYKFGNFGALQNNSSFRLEGINATIDVVNAN